ncbi:MAG: HAD-IIA family hydrolase [Lachnospiraceae bacterium]|nr:HAD-IIA family hydrolase [Lachnospiraceae bacterium]
MLDYNRKPADELKQKSLWLLDMDGTIYEENRIFDGTLALLDTIEARGGRYVFLTNNSSRSVEDYIKKVTAMGIRADRDSFFTSAQATVLYLKENLPGALIYCQGTESLVKELKDAGIRVTTEMDLAAEAVLIGFDTELTFQKLRNTCELLTKKDIPYIATNPDFVCPTDYGFVPDCGSMMIGIRYATGKMPVVIGKPEPTMIEIAEQKFGKTPADTVLIGDRLYTDIASGVNAGVATIAVLSGEAKYEEIMAYEKQPTYVFQSVKEICEGLLE